MLLAGTEQSQQGTRPVSDSILAAVGAHHLLSLKKALNLATYMYQLWLAFHFHFDKKHENCKFKKERKEVSC